MLMQPNQKDIQSQQIITNVMDFNIGTHTNNNSLKKIKTIKTKYKTL